MRFVTFQQGRGYSRGDVSPDMGLRQHHAVLAFARAGLLARRAGEERGRFAGKDDGQATGAVVLGGPDLTAALAAVVET